MKLLDVALLGVLASMASAAQAQAPQSTSSGSTQPTPAAQQDQDVKCGAEGCTSDAGVLFKIRTRGERQPVTTGSTEKAGSERLEPDRRVTVETGGPEDVPGRATAVGKWSVQLPGGGVVWATEDPDLGQPQMSVMGQTMLPFDGSRITKPVRFMGYSNYAAFIKRAEVLVFRASDTDLVSPLAAVPLKLGNMIEGEWDGSLSTDVQLRAGDELVYVVRAWSDGKTYDETFPQRMQLLRPEEVEIGLNRLRGSMDQAAMGRPMTAEAADKLRMVQGTFGQNTLRRQNIPVYGSRVRIHGRNVPQDYSLTINGQSIPVDMERKFVAEYLLPIGKYGFVVAGKSKDGEVSKTLDIDVSGKYFFGVALADFTLSGNTVSGNLQPLAGDSHFTKNSLAEGRLAFYMKGKAKGKYLITAQADTQEKEVSQLFRGFWKADPQDIFRRLDPDRYYPVYGDDSTTFRDVDTMGRLYVRVDWDKNQLLWGNYQTGITGTEYGQYSRGLYGAAASLRTNTNTKYAEPTGQLRVFGSQAQTAPGHSEFIGTGGSLYYLKHTDVLPGSEKVVLEVRDAATGRVENRINLISGVDYEMDDMQGRIILTRPLAQVTRENVRTITRDMPLDGFSQMLLVDYEYVPQGFKPDELTAGFRGRYWLGNHVGVGATYVDERRAGDDYRMAGADLTLRAGQGTYLKLEQTRTRATSAPVFFSDNGGLSFTQTNALQPNRSGSATAVEARLNARELGWTQRDWTAGAWWRKVDAGFSVTRFDNGFAVREYGAEVLGDINDVLRMYARASKAERGADSLAQAQLTMDWRINDRAMLSGEVRRVDETRAGTGAAGTLLAAKYNQRIGSSLDVYGIGQFTLDDDGGKYGKNNAVTVGAKYIFHDLSNIGGEVVVGDRGNAASINGEYRISPDHSVYGNYTYSTDTTKYDPLFNPRVTPGWTLGQRWRLSNQVTIFNESQFLKAPRESGLAHTFGMDFYPAIGWNLGFTLQNAQLDKSIGNVDRKAVSVHGGRTSQDMQWQSKLEWRKDSGAEQRQQWVTTNWLNVKLNESWRIAARINYSDTKDTLQAAAGARFAEANLGFAWRPWNTTKYALLGKYTFLYDVSALQQQGDNVAFYDQKSHVLSLEGIYHPSHNWEFAGKLARRDGSVRFGRLAGEWADSGATFAAIQARYGIGNTDWNALAEYRWLGVKHGGARNGALIGLDRDITQNFRIGVGYNFTDFSDNLTDFDYRHRGWFLNVVGRY